MGKMIRVTAQDGSGSFEVYCARPEARPRAAIIVIQEIFGVNEGIQHKCDRLAEAGYLAFAPDLFWRLEPGVQLDPDVPEQFQAALGLMQRFDQDKGVEDIAAAIATARNLTEGCKVGCVGYCLGGRLAYMAAARTDIDASVGYYAVYIPNLLGEKDHIKAPLMLHIAGADHFVPADQQAEIHAGLDDHPMVTLHDYPGLDHGFATEMGVRRHEEGANLADSRTMALFANALLG
jgi:carboxymethylenebutenolidase